MSRIVQVLRIARANRLLKPGNIALDGTRARANASRHSARSYGHALKLREQLQAEVETLLRLAEAADQAQPAEGSGLINTPFQPVGSPLIKSEYPCVHTSRS